MAVPEAAALHSALLEAFETYVTRTAQARGYALPPQWEAAVASGAAWLDEQLGRLFDEPFSTQRRAPLEIFQEALAEPNRALAAAGVEPPPRDEGAVRALPGDVYDLAPASSHDLGEDVWRAHLTWGAAKAAAMTAAATPGPRVGYLGSNLMDRATIESAARATGLGFVAVTVLEEVDAEVAAGGLVRAFVDLTHPGADDAIRRLAPARTRVVAFGPHVDDFAMTRARSLGADDVVPRSRFFRKLEEYLPRMV